MIHLCQCIKQSTSRLSPKCIRLQRLHSSTKTKKQNDGIMHYFLLIVPATTAGLGIWQLRRREWKLNLIDNLNQKLFENPVPIENLFPIDVKCHEYRRVTLTGEFDHSREILLEPRVLHELNYNDLRQPPMHVLIQYRKIGKSSGGAGGLGSNQHANGVQVITPFKLKSSGKEILVNRGWVPRARKQSTNRNEGQVSGEITIDGIVRGSEKKPNFLLIDNNINDGHFVYRDVNAMATCRSTLPVYVEADVHSSIVGGPIGGQTTVQLRNEHMQYVITWWSLSVLTAFLWLQKYGPLR